ncbi:scarecrow-like protein 8 [Canna indica]|uniref:Scarecrow-like protein 8 n=1 Tax=Canna indica TaxID=4628 RepID=A0AAQ3KEU5_9LILI|nr:scarecrow-like protein 8 [Canna indica]
MASEFPGRELGFGASGGGGNVLKRTLADMERQQQMQLQMHHALLQRSVRQRRPLPSISGFPSAVRVGEIVGNSFSLAAHQSTALGGHQLLGRQEMLQPASVTAMKTAPPLPENRSSGSVEDQLRELERRLLLDDDEADEADAEASASSGSAVSHAEWTEIFHGLLSPKSTVLLPAVTRHLSSSPTDSASSTVSVASSSPPSSTPSPPPSLRQMLLDTATAISEGHMEAATANLAVLKRAADPRGDAEQRLTAVMVAALLSRLNSPQIGNSHPIADLRSPEHFVATKMLYDLSPCFKLGFIACNSAILEATKDVRKIQIVDFEVGHGAQYASLLHALSERRRNCPSFRPPAIRVTAAADPLSPFTNINIGSLRTVGDWIEKLAEQAGVSLRFSVVSRPVAELDAASLGCEPGGEEALVVNLAFVLSRVPDESVSPDNPRDDLLRRVRTLRPRLVALVEQEINTSTAALPARLAEACGHYGALLESMEATARGRPERGRAEAGLARRVANAVAKEGAERVERCEVFGKWRARMGMAGFEPVQIGPAVIEPVKLRLANSWSNSGLTVKEEAGGLALGLSWMGRVVTVASAWR